MGFGDKENMLNSYFQPNYIISISGTLAFPRIASRDEGNGGNTIDKPRS